MTALPIKCKLVDLVASLPKNQQHKADGCRMPPKKQMTGTVIQRSIYLSPLADEILQREAERTEKSKSRFVSDLIEFSENITPFIECVVERAMRRVLLDTRRHVLSKRLQEAGPCME